MAEIAHVEDAHWEYAVYRLACAGDTIYTGITTDVVRRLREHLSGLNPGARYTRSHQPTALLALWDARNRADASALEWHIKHLSRERKDALVRGSITASELVGEDAEFARVDESVIAELWAEAIRMLA